MEPIDDEVIHLSAELIKVLNTNAIDPRFDFRKGFITHGAMVIFCEILSQPNEDSDRHVEDGTSPDAIGVEETFADPSIDDWNLDFNLPESRLFGGWESNQPWGLRI